MLTEAMQTLLTKPQTTVLLYWVHWGHNESNILLTHMVYELIHVIHLGHVHQIAKSSYSF